MGLMFYSLWIISISLYEIGGVPLPAIQDASSGFGSFQDLSGMIEAGQKEFGVGVPESIVYERFNYDQVAGPVNIHLIAKNSKITGYDGYRVLNLALDKKENVIRFEFEVPYVKIESDYKLSGNAFFFPIQGAGPATFEIVDHKMSGHAKYEIMDNLSDPNKGKIIQLREPVISSIEIGDMRSKIGGLYEDNPLLSSLAKYIEIRYWRDIFELAKPEVSKHAGNLIINQILNPILEKTPFLKS